MVAQNRLLAVPSDFKEKLAILHKVDRPLSELRVTQFCEEQGISRKRFYALFRSKYDIVFWYFDICNEMGLYQIGRSLNWAEGFALTLQYVSEELEFLRRESAKERPSGSFAENKLRSRTKRQEIILETLREYRRVSVDEGLEAEVGLYAKMEGEILTMWLLGETKMNTPEFIQFWEDCVPRRLYRALQPS